MNMKMNLNFKPAALLALLRRFGPSLAGLAVVAIFGYTGWVINQAFNVQPAELGTTTATPRITFDKKTIDTVKSLRVVPGGVTPGALGKSDPFGN
jgi:hypothetical protein